MIHTDNTIGPQDGAKVINVFKETFSAILNNVNKKFPNVVIIRYLSYQSANEKWKKNRVSKIKARTLKADKQLSMNFYDLVSLRILRKI